MRWIDLYPLKGFFQPEETVRLATHLQTAEPFSGALRMAIIYMAETVAELEVPLELEPGEHWLTVAWQPPERAPVGYGVEAWLIDGSGELVLARSTAFDVLYRWTDFPRYGFLCDFFPGRADADQTLDALARYHLNGLQFYDWQYRHDQLLPPKRLYQDALGRELSFDTVLNLISAAHAYGMKAMLYLAVYAASLEFWQTHPDWALYDPGNPSKPLTFEGFLGLVDPSPGSPWVRHLLEECGRALKALPFDGLHIDQYGQPKVAFNARGQAVDLPEAFKAFLITLRQAYPQAELAFNAVGNWPIEVLCTAPQDFAYIEIWPPDVAYQDLHRIISQARTLSGGKGVVVALYLPAEWAENVRLADALIFACGGMRIEIGERERLLSDPYFPKHQAIPPELLCNLRATYDFAVRYEALIGPAAGDAPDVEIRALTEVCAIPRAAPGWLGVHLVNFSGLGEALWEAPHPAPTTLSEVKVELRLPEPFPQVQHAKVRGVYWASPDKASQTLEPLDWRQEDDRLLVTLPRLEYWSLLAFELDQESLVPASLYRRQDIASQAERSP